MISLFYPFESHFLQKCNLSVVPEFFWLSIILAGVEASRRSNILARILWIFSASDWTYGTRQSGCRAEGAVFVSVLLAVTI